MEEKTWLDEIVQPSGRERIIPKPKPFTAHPFKLSGLLVLVGLQIDCIRAGKFATAAHAKRAARDFARRPVNWNKF